MKDQSEPILTIPEEPIDQYQVKHYCLYMLSIPVSVAEIVAVYHQNTPWHKYCQDETHSRGADIVDQWMVFENGSPCGRIVGWTGIHKAFVHPGNFLTREDAIKAAIKKLNNERYRLALRDKELQESVCGLKAQLPDLSAAFFPSTFHDVYEAYC